MATSERPGVLRAGGGHGCRGARLSSAAAVASLPPARQSLRPPAPCAASQGALQTKTWPQGPPGNHRAAARGHGPARCPPPAPCADCPDLPASLQGQGHLLPAGQGEAEEEAGGRPGEILGSCGESLSSHTGEGRLQPVDPTCPPVLAGRLPGRRVVSPLPQHPTGSPVRLPRHPADPAPPLLPHGSFGLR